MTITVNTPDGGTASFPDGTDPGTITSVMKAKFGGPAALTDDSVSGQIGNTLYHAVNTGTFHLPDYLLAGTHALERGTGIDPNATDLSQIRAENEDFSAKHPILSAGADVAGYAPLLIPGVGEAVGMGKIGGALADLGMNSRLAAGLGTAAESGAISGAGALTGGASASDSLKAAGVGAAIGGPLGALASKAAAPSVGGSIADLQAAKDAAVNAAENTKVGNLAPYQDFTAARSSLTPGVKSGITPAMKSKLDDVEQLIADNADLNAKDIWSMRKNINNIAQKGTPEDKVAAKTVGDSLYNLAPNEIGAASMAHARVQDANWLQNTTDPAKLVTGAQSRLDNPQMLMDSATQQAMQNLANSAPGNINQGLRTLGAYGINKGIAGAGLGFAGQLFGEGGLGGMLGLAEGGGKGIGGYITSRGLNAGTMKAKKAALNTILTGQLTTPGQYSNIPKVAGALANVNNIVGQSGSY